MDQEDEHEKAWRRGGEIAQLTEALTIIALCLAFIGWMTYYAIRDWPCWTDSGAQLPECRDKK